MQNYKMTIAYDGRKYKGFNKTKDNRESSIQGILERILGKLYEKEIQVDAAVNTNAGVHAKAQVVSFVSTSDTYSKKEIFECFEEELTDDIIVLSLEEETRSFHSKYKMKSATYHYRLWKKNAPNRPLFERKTVNQMVQLLDVNKMKKASEQLIGEHNFLAFTTNRKTRNSIKEIFDIDIKETTNEIIISMTADGFLLNMERLIVGTLVQIGLGQLPVDSIENAYSFLDLDAIGHKASASALSLLSIQY